ncbi:MAG: helix-turn-helix domain-containing protein [Lachnospiraceae bacterium]|nr:helix-turn-helix domain-containing protein [Lachnospiraceae bacterium]
MKIKELRLQKNVSQKEAAEQLGCTASQYYKYEAEVRQPSIDMLIRMSEYFGTSIDYIVENPLRLSDSLSAYEKKLVELARKADGRAQKDALLLLENNPLKEK